MILQNSYFKISKVCFIRLRYRVLQKLFFLSEKYFFFHYLSYVYTCLYSQVKMFSKSYEKSISKLFMKIWNPTFCKILPETITQNSDGSFQVPHRLCKHLEQPVQYTYRLYKAKRDGTFQVPALLYKRLEQTVQYTYRLYKAKRDDTRIDYTRQNGTVHIYSKQSKTGRYTYILYKAKRDGTRIDYTRQNGTVHI